MQIVFVELTTYVGIFVKAFGRQLCYAMAQGAKFRLWQAEEENGFQPGRYAIDKPAPLARAVDKELVNKMSRPGERENNVAS